jgi:pimeloyl-ACP methyl ester carboxylesterase
MSYSRPAAALPRQLIPLLSDLFPSAFVGPAVESVLRPPRPRLSRVTDDLQAEARHLRFALGTEAASWGRVGRPVALVVHGWGGAPAQFGGLIPLLLAQGWRVVALHPPGHGPRGHGDDAHVLGFARAILEAAVELPELRCVIGHSMGGAAALFAVQLGLTVERLVCLAAPASLRRMLRRRAASLGLGARATQAFIAAHDARLGASSAALDAAAFAARLRPRLLLVHDQDDREVPFSEAEALHAAAPQAQLLATRGLGHLRLLRDADTLRAVADFLRSALAPQLRAA